MRKGFWEECGFTLVEAVVALAIFSMISVALFYLMAGSYRSYWREVQQQEVEANLRQALDRISLRVRQAEKIEKIDPQNPSTGIIVTLPGGASYTYAYDPAKKELKENGQPVASHITGVEFSVREGTVSVYLEGEYLGSGRLALSTQVRTRVGEQG
ncbi:hypothetical protein Adeg_1720 [Ammonifex degensii KC4]|uniref:Prepilin-type N-terminal cleavage/methylation domain-containing protein n=1 Tax=Ammonifex degensii (strain DSM 10501 / KC4) TaxID=429009 RepID=C9R933_AMMDK|nr:prepilin-type N-terminal cleavage/methylation domain-containing protein [Ammonifex degensii]ACX52812.1 hypothetical protein Adeg_1720 [Ammonifex degensii KC4]